MGAASPSTAFCTRPGADVRAPSTNGSCPSGYTKTDVLTVPGSPPPSSALGFTASHHADVDLSDGARGTYHLPLSGESSAPRDHAQFLRAWQVIPRATTVTTMRVRLILVADDSAGPVTVEVGLRRLTADGLFLLGPLLTCEVSVSQADWSETELHRSCTASPDAPLELAAGDSFHHELIVTGPAQGRVDIGLATSVSLA